MKAVEVIGWAINALPDGSARKPSRRLPPEAIRQPVIPSLADVRLQVCCPTCARKAYRFIAWWEGSRHVLIDVGCVRALTSCDTCGAEIAAGDPALVFVFCDDVRTAVRCRAFLRWRGPVESDHTDPAD